MSPRTKSSRSAAPSDACPSFDSTYWSEKTFFNHFASAAKNATQYVSSRLNNAFSKLQYQIPRPKKSLITYPTQTPGYLPVLQPVGKNDDTPETQDLKRRVVIPSTFFPENTAGVVQLFISTKRFKQEAVFKHKKGLIGVASPEIKHLARLTKLARSRRGIPRGLNKRSESPEDLGSDLPLKRQCRLSVQQRTTANILLSDVQFFQVFPGHLPRPQHEVYRFGSGCNYFLPSFTIGVENSSRSQTPVSTPSDDCTSSIGSQAVPDTQDIQDIQDAQVIQAEPVDQHDQILAYDPLSPVNGESSASQPTLDTAPAPVLYSPSSPSLSSNLQDFCNDAGKQLMNDLLGEEADDEDSGSDDSDKTEELDESESWQFSDVSSIPYSPDRALSSEEIEIFEPLNRPSKEYLESLKAVRRKDSPSSSRFNESDKPLEYKPLSLANLHELDLSQFTKRVIEAFKMPLTYTITQSDFEKFEWLMIEMVRQQKVMAWDQEQRDVLRGEPEFDLSKVDLESPADVTEAWAHMVWTEVVEKETWEGIRPSNLKGAVISAINPEDANTAPSTALLDLNSVMRRRLGMQSDPIDFPAFGIPQTQAPAGMTDLWRAEVEELLGFINQMPIIEDDHQGKHRVNCERNRPRGWHLRTNGGRAQQRYVLPAKLDEEARRPPKVRFSEEVEVREYNVNDVSEYLGQYELDLKEEPERKRRPKDIPTLNPRTNYSTYTDAPAVTTDSRSPEYVAERFYEDVKKSMLQRIQRLSREYPQSVPEQRPTPQFQAAERRRMDREDVKSLWKDKRKAMEIFWNEWDDQQKKKLASPPRVRRDVNNNVIEDEWEDYWDN